MEGYTVISSKKVSLGEVAEQDEQKVEIAPNPDVHEITSSPLPFDQVNIPCSPVPSEVIEIPCSPTSDDVVELLSDDDNDDCEENICEDDNGSEVLGLATNNDSEEIICEDNDGAEVLALVTNNDSEEIVCDDNNSAEVLGCIINNDNEAFQEIGCENNNSSNVLGTVTTNISNNNNAAEVIYEDNYSLEELSCMINKENEAVEEFVAEDNNSSEVLGYLTNKNNEKVEEVNCEDNNSSEVVGYLTNRESHETEEIICGDNNSSEILGQLTNNQCNVPKMLDEDVVSAINNIFSTFNRAQSNDVTQNMLSNNSIDSNPAQIDQSNSLQLDTPTTSSELYVDQNGLIQNAALENCSEYFTIDYIASPTDDNSAIELSDQEECTEILTGSETDDAMETGNAKQTANTAENDETNVSLMPYRRSNISKCNDSIDKYTSYLCPQCGINCGSIQKWKLHTESVHAFGLFETANFQSIVNKHGQLCHKCRDCPKIFENAKGFSLMIAHRITHLPFKDYFSCLLCSKRYRTKTTLRHHLQRSHSELNVKTLPKYKDNALQHLRFVCPVCNAEQSNHCDWRSHINEQHNYYKEVQSKFKHVGNNNYSCSVCAAIVRSATFIDHMLTHEEFKSFICTVCDSALSQLKAALSHVRWKHLACESNWNCSLCKASFESLHQRRMHFVAKHKIIAQKCKVCNKTFSSSSSLLTHINTENHYSLKSRT